MLIFVIKRTGCNVVAFLFKAKSRRQSKPYKPKKIIKMEGKIVVYTACNNGSSSVVSKDGELYMFGKDAIYSDNTSKLNFFAVLKYVLVI